MSRDRTHYVTTSDGVSIGGTVHGRGAPIVFLQGIIGDGDLDFGRLLPHLTDRFTCHLPSMRGRGLSGDHSDSDYIGGVTADYVTYVESVGEPVRLVGWSAGANHALGVAARSDAVIALAPYEPVANSVMDEQEMESLGSAVAAAGAAAAAGDLAGAMRAFARYPLNDDDIEAAEAAGYFEAAGRYAPHMMETFEQLVGYEGTLPDDPAVLSEISVPTLVISGSETRPFMADSARYIIEHVADARIREIPGAGHAAPITHPEEMAAALVEFLEPASENA